MRLLKHELTPHQPRKERTTHVPSVWPFAKLVQDKSRVGRSPPRGSCLKNAPKLPPDRRPCFETPGTHLRSTPTSSIPLSPPPSIVPSRDENMPSVRPCCHGTPPTTEPPPPPPTPPRSAILRARPAAMFLETPPRRKFLRTRNRAMPTKGRRRSVIAATRGRLEGGGQGSERWRGRVKKGQNELYMPASHGERATAKQAGV